MDAKEKVHPKNIKEEISKGIMLQRTKQEKEKSLLVN